MRIGKEYNHVKFGFLYVSLFFGERRFNGRQIYGLMKVRDNPADYWVLFWGNRLKQL